MTFPFDKPDIGAKCLECGLEIPDGEIPTRSLDAFDEDPDPYCPQCDSDSLELLLPRERED